MANKVTLKQIAQEVGLSPSSVSLVLNNRPCRISEENRRLIKEVAARNHYVPNQIARSLVMRESRTLGLIVPNIESRFFASLAGSLEKRCREDGYALFITSSGGSADDDLELLRQLVTRGVDGVFLVVGDEFSDDRALREEVSHLPIPAVMVDRAIEGLECDKVMFDHEMGGYMALTVVLGFAICSFGLQNGLERVSKLMMLALLALILVLQVHGVNVSSLIAGLGIIGAIVGLALQDMLKDVIMGTNILTGEYFAVGDVIKYGDLIGEVVQFSLRSTKIRELATTNIVTVSNRNIFEATRVSNELFITVPTSYADDPNTIEPFLQQLAREISALPDVESCDFLGLSNLGEYSVDYLWGLRAKPAVQSAVRRRVLGHIRHRFAENGFTIPYPQMDVHTD